MNKSRCLLSALLMLGVISLPENHLQLVTTNLPVQIALLKISRQESPQHSTLSFSWFYKSQSSFSALTFSFKPLVFPSAPNPGWYPWSLSAQGKGSLGPQIWYWLPGWVNQCVSQGLMLPSTSHSWTNNEESCIYGSVWAFTFGSVGVFCL